MANSRQMPLHGSEHSPMPGARAIGPSDPHELVEISVMVRRRQPLAAQTNNGKFLSHDEFARTYGADPADIEKVRQFARASNLQMLERGDEVHRRTVTLAGTAAAMEKAFGIELMAYEHPEGTYRGFTGAIQIPEAYAPVIQAVLGLDNRPVAHPHFRLRNSNRAFGSRASQTSYNPPQVASHYGFPTDVDGSGQTIGILEFGGGYRPADLQQYFQSLNLKTPAVRAVLVDHAKNRPSTPQSADGEVMLDIEVAGSIANGASMAVYFAPNTARGFADALSTAVHDQLNTPSVISLSWGGPESSWSQQAINAINDVAQEASTLGINIFVAAGDSGSSDGVPSGQSTVDFPASSPYVFACGGTRLEAGHGPNSETVWNDGGQGGATGGGFSAVFSRPAYQDKGVTGSARGVPDAAGNADPETGYNILVDGQAMVVGGTSAVAPLWAALTCLLMEQFNGKIGFLNSIVYSIDPSSGFRDILHGNNGAYSAGPGWDPCTGLGSPIANKLVEAIARSTGLSVARAGHAGRNEPAAV